MGQSTFPVPSSGSSTSTVLPVNASSVILDGSLTSAGTYTTTVNGNGSPAYLVASVNPATITVGGTAYSVPANTVVASKAFGASTSVTVAANVASYSGAPTTFTSSTLSSSLYWRSVTFGNGTYVAVGCSSSNTGTTAGAYSTDGTSWTAMTMPSSSTWYGVAYGNNVFVAVQGNSSSYGNASAYSANGITWTAGTMPSNQFWQRIIYVSTPSFSGFVAGEASGSTQVAYSTDGINWATRNTTYAMNGGALATNGTVIVQTNTTQQYIDVITPGATWSDTSYLAFNQQLQWTGVAYGNGIWVAVNNAASTSARYLTAIDPTSAQWSASTMPSQYFNSVVYGGGYFVAISTNNNAATTAGAYSTNGSTWTASTFPSGIWRAICYGSTGKFMAVAADPSTSAAYFQQSANYVLPVNFGIYAGPTTVN